MILKEKRLKIIICALIIFSFVFLSLPPSSVFAWDIFGRSKTKASVEGKIESAQRKIDEERYQIRLQQARQYLEKGDYYYGRGRLLEALGEWYAALALIEILRDVEIESVEDARAILEREVKERLKVDKARPEIKDQRRLSKIDEAVERILKEQAEAEAEVAKIKQEKEKVVKEIVPDIVPEIEKKLSLQELEIMKKNREAVEKRISQQLARERKIEELEPKETVKEIVKKEIIVEEKKFPEEKALITKKDKILKRKIELDLKTRKLQEREDKRAEAKARREERIAEAKARQQQKRKEKQRRIQEARERLAQKRKARAQKLDMRTALAEQKRRKRTEAVLAKKDTVLKRQMEASLSRELAAEKNKEVKLKKKIEKGQRGMFRQRRGEDKLDEQLKAKEQALLQKQIDRQAKERKDLKAKIERKEKEDFRLLEKGRQRDIQYQLKHLEKEQRQLEKEQRQLEKEQRKTAIRARKEAAKKRKAMLKSQAAGKEEVSVSVQQPDRFDIIDRLLRKLERQCLD